MFNPYIVCTWAFLVSLLYPLHGITTFPLNILCVGGIMGAKLNELSYATFYSIFSHIGPFLWVPWIITFESVILCLSVFYFYTLYMLIICKKNPLQYYVDNESRKEHKDLLMNATSLLNF